jgi:hypothetical protein
MKMRDVAPFRASAMAIAAAVWMLAAIHTARSDEPERPAKKDSPRPRLRLSREVTYFTEPLAKDGLIDYAAALNARYAKDLSAKNNAAIPLVSLLGRGYTEEDDFAKLCARLEIEVPDKTEGQFVDMHKFVERVHSDFLDDEEVTARKLKLTPAVLREQLARDDWIALFNRYKEVPWSAAEEPLISAWLDAMHDPLATFRDLAERPRYFVPYRSDDLFSGMLGASFQSMPVVDALRIRAMRSLAAGETDRAWKDVMTIRRWAALVCQPPTIVDQVVAMVFVEYASAAACVVVSDAKLTSPRIKALHAEWKTVSAMPDMGESLAVGERCFGLDVVNALHRSALDPALLRAMNGFLEPYPEEIVESPWRRRAIDAVLDWNAVYETMNLFYDDLAAVGKMPSGKARKEAGKKLEDRIERITAQQANPFQWFTIAVLDHGARRRAIGRYFVAGRFIAATMPMIGGVFDSEDRLRMHVAMTDVAFALARYRAASGNYPARLEELVPVLLDKLPEDALGEGPLRYKRRGDGGFELYSIGVNGKDDAATSQQPFVDTTDARKDAEAADEEADDIIIRVGPPR